MSAEQTYWNGEPCEARRVEVVVADAEFPLYWAREFVGEVRAAVEVTYGGSTFYLDDEGYRQSEESYTLHREHARALVTSVGGRMTEEQALERMGVKPEAADGSHFQTGYPGHGWAKVTAGRGSPSYGHSSLKVDRVLAPDAPATEGRA